MKRGKLMLTVLVVLAMLFASCSSHLKEGDAEGGSSAKTVRVSLGVDVEDGVGQRSISANTNLGDMTFWYKAKHDWTQTRPVHGDTDGFVLIPNYDPDTSPTSDLGYFTAGPWLFSVQVKKGNNIIYSATDFSYTIYNGHAAPVIPVTPDGTTGTGTINVTVKVPATGAGESLLATGVDSLVMARDPNGPGTDPNDPDTYNLITFTGSKSGLTPGAYTIAFKYTDASGTATTEGAAVAVNVFAGQTSEITGLIDAGKWWPSTITIKAPGINYTSLLPASAHRTPNDPISTDFTATATSTLNNEITYAWYINGVGPQQDLDPPNVLPFSRNDIGMYDITCTATDTTAKVTASKTVYVQVGYSVATPTSPIALGTLQTVFAPGDIVPLTYTGNLTGLTVSGVDAADIEWDNVAHKASFRMPSQNVTAITGSF